MKKAKLVIYAILIPATLMFLAISCSASAVWGS